MSDLNYHHLKYFREVARQGNLTQAADRLNVSQSALSTQIKTLEARLGHALFDRVGRRLVLTEVGRMALDHADRIFNAGDELLATLQGGHIGQHILRVGALSTLSRNFQLRFLQPLLTAQDCEIILTSGSRDTLLASLRDLSLDVALMTDPPIGEDGLIAQKIDEAPVALHGRPGISHATNLVELLKAHRVVLPTESSIRTGFDALTSRLGVEPRVAALVDDMAMVRLLAREGAGLAVAPSVVFADEIASGRLATAPFDLGIFESFYAVTVRRRFPNPVLDRVLPRRGARLMAAAGLDEAAGET